MIKASGSSELSPPWGRRELPGDAPLGVSIGPSRLWLEAAAGEIRVAHEEASPHRGEAGTSRGGAETPEGAASSRPPDDVEWIRWATPGGEREVELLPALPDRTVVLEPESPFRLLPGAEARIFVRVPLWIRIDLPLGGGGAERLTLQEIPSLPMSDTWWGDYLGGELVYWLPTTARREMRPELHLPHLAVCPLHLVNRSGSDLEVEKLAFRVEHLTLFADGDRLWADEARVSYQGEAEGSQIEMSGAAPAEARKAIEVTSPRSPIQRGFRARTFDRLRQLPGVGGVL